MPYPISRISDQGNYQRETSKNRVSWLDGFAEKLNAIANDPKTAVEVARRRDERSLLDRITSIVSGKGKSAVDQIVSEYQERTGLAAYLSSTAQSNDTFESVDDGTRADIQNYIRNLIDSHHGNIHIPAILESMKGVFKNRGLSDLHLADPELAKLINQELIGHKKQNPDDNENFANLGKGLADDSNEVVEDDALLGNVVSF